jgi:hypothetical protein
MQCPNCRKIEKGRWLYATGHRPSPDIDIGGWVTGETYDITSDLVSALLMVHTHLGDQNNIDLYFSVQVSS